MNKNEQESMWIKQLDNVDICIRLRAVEKLGVHNSRKGLLEAINNTEKRVAEKAFHSLIHCWPEDWKKYIEKIEKSKNSYIKCAAISALTNGVVNKKINKEPIVDMLIEFLNDQDPETRRFASTRIAILVQRCFLYNKIITRNDLKRFEIALKKTIDKDKKSEIIVAHKMTIQALEENCD